MTLKNALDEYMKEHKIQGETMAKLVGVSYSTIHRYRHNGIVPSLEVARRIQKATQCKVTLAHWGYRIVKGKFVRPPKSYASKLSAARYVPNQED